MCAACSLASGRLRRLPSRLGVGVGVGVEIEGKVLGLGLG